MNPLRILASSLALLASLSQSTHAQTATSSQPPVRDPQAIALASQSLAAMGAASVSSQTDSRATGVMTMYFGTPVQIAVTLESKGLTRVRSVSQQPTGTSVWVLNAGQSAIQQPDGSVRQLSQANTFYEHVGHIPALSMLAEVQNPIASVELVASAAASNSTDSVVAISMGQSDDPFQVQIQRTLSRTLFYINSASGIVDKIEHDYYSEAPNPGIRMHIVETFSDYRNVGGIAVPFHRATFVDGNPESDLQLSSIGFNVGVPASDFVVPAVAQ
jgi:hypothetical protein